MEKQPYVLSFNRYVRLYTLHQVERPADLICLRIRIETLRYGLLPLSSLPLDAAYADDPHEGIALVRATVRPRLEALLDSPDPFERLGLAPAREALWQRYASVRGLPVTPVRVPVITPSATAPRLPARSQVSARLAQAQRALEMFHMAVDTASTLAALWQNWQIGREQRRLLTAQRRLLESAVSAQIAGQERALIKALDGDFVRGYLDEHAGDAAYDAIFGDEPDAND